MVILKGILLVVLALSACVLMLTFAATLIVDSADSVASVREKADLKAENKHLKAELERMRRMP